MSWSLQLHHGDFVTSGATFTTVTDETKLVQDLRCALLERMGTDDLHPDFGSLIDGGTLTDGTEVPSVVSMDANTVATEVQAELQRISRNYQNQQLNRAKDDRTVYNRVTLTPGEVLITITDIQLVQEQDTLTATVVLQTARGENITIALPISTT